MHSEMTVPDQIGGEFVRGVLAGDGGRFGLIDVTPSAHLAISKVRANKKNRSESAQEVVDNVIHRIVRPSLPTFVRHGPTPNLVSRAEEGTCREKRG